MIIINFIKKLQTGQYHTLDVEQNRKFVLKKPEWDSIALDRIDMACDITQVSSLLIKYILFYTVII